MVENPLEPVNVGFEFHLLICTSTSGSNISKAAIYTASIVTSFQIGKDKSTPFAKLLTVGPRNHIKVTVVTPNWERKNSWPTTLKVCASMVGGRSRHR